MNQKMAGASCPRLLPGRLAPNFQRVGIPKGDFARIMVFYRPDIFASIQSAMSAKIG